MRSVSRQVGSGVVAGPLFVGLFTAIGATHSGYDWRREPVSSLACGRGGWLQRANFIITGALYCSAALGLGRASGCAAGSRAVPTLVGAAGVGLIASGVFVMDPVGDYPPGVTGKEGLEDTGATKAVPSREEMLHNLAAIPIFVGIPTAGLVSAFTAARGHQHRWASYSAASSVGMLGSFLLFGAASGASKKVAGKGGIFQRISIASGFGWLTALFLRTLRLLQQQRSS